MTSNPIRPLHHVRTSPILLIAATTMDSVSVKKNVIELEERLKITFPKPYFDFLCHIKADDVFEVEGSGIGLFSYSDLEERNETYEVRAYEPNYLMIGQDGDMGYFVSTNTPNDHSIYANDLGALGSLPMNKVANDIFELISKFQ